MRNSRGNMLLIELMIVLLFFSLAQVTVVQVFAAAHQQAMSSRATHTALTIAQDMAERMHGANDPAQVLMDSGFVLADDTYVLEKDRGFVLQVKLSQLSQPAGVLRTAVFTAVNGEKTLFTFPGVSYEGASVP